VTKSAVTNLPASVRQRLLNLSHQRQEDFNLVLSLSGIEAVRCDMVPRGAMDCAGG